MTDKDKIVFASIALGFIMGVVHCVSQQFINKKIREARSEEMIIECEEIITDCEKILGNAK